MSIRSAINYSQAILTRRKMERSCLGLETELRLGLPGGGGADVEQKKRGFSDISGGGEEKAAAAAKKNQVVGWPPVCAYRRKNGFGGVKVSMDGAPFLRKMDLSNHKCYSDLVRALQHLFGIEEAENCELVPIYEDKDGDWMLLGDVPWEMFAESCKRVRIMKRSSDAKGIGLQAKDLLKGLAKED